MTQKRSTWPMQRMAKGSRYDDFVYAHAKQATLQVFSNPSSRESLSPAQQAIARYQVMTVLMPTSLYAVLGACRGWSSSPARTASCKRIGQLLTDSGSLADQSFGHAILAEAVWANHTPLRLSRDGLITEWRSRLMRQLSWRLDCDAALADLWLDAIRTHDAETEADETVLAARHLPLNPPANWIEPPPQPPPPPGASACAK